MKRLRLALAKIPRLLLANPALLLALTLVCLLIFASVVYMALEGWSLLDSLYFVVSTVTTVGYGNIVPSNSASEAFTVFFMLLSMSLLVFASGNLLLGVARRAFRGESAMEKAKKTIAELRDHMVVAAEGDIAHLIVHDLAQKGSPFVVITKDETLFKQYIEQGRLSVLGNPDDDEVLEQSNLRAALGLIVAMASDADNVFVSLSARRINPNLRIAAEARSTSSISKLKYAGVDDVVVSQQVTAFHFTNLFSSPERQSELIKVAADNVRQALSGVDCSLRPTLGGKVDTAMFRAIRMSLSEMGPEMGKALYALGEQFGRLAFAPNVQATDLVGVMDELACLWQNAGLGTVKVREVRDGVVVVDEGECMTCYGMPNVGKKVCAFEGGILAGLVSEKLGRAATSSELKCNANGDGMCQYEIVVGRELGRQPGTLGRPGSE